MIEIYLVGNRVADAERAEVILEGLGARRPVFGEAGMWRVLYEADDTTEALRGCEADLAEQDPAWLEILDFKALPRR